MTSDDFVRLIRDTVYAVAVKDVETLLASPPGRRPPPSLIELSQWHEGLSGEDRQRVHMTTQLAARAAVFGFFAVLDGVTSIRDAGETGGLIELRYIENGESVLLNAPTGALLHDLFAAAVPMA